MNRNLRILSAEEHVDDGSPNVLQLPNDADPLAIEVCRRLPCGRFLSCVLNRKCNWSHCR